MSLKSQIISNQIEELASNQGIDDDKAFLKYVHSLVMGSGPASFDDEDIVDGGQDKQIDAISIEEGEERADVFITQATVSDGFSSNKLIQMANGLKWVFQASKKDLQKISNQALKDKIAQFRLLQSELGPANLNIHVSFAALAETESLSDEFQQEYKHIVAEYGTDVFESFEMNILGVDEISNLAKARDRRTRSVDAELKMRYDANVSSLISYRSQGLKGMVCTIPATELAKLVNEHPDGSIFDLNIRQYLGGRGVVNRSIQETASGDESHEFWFLNNGVTIVCDKFDAVTDPDDPKVILKNLQIVNGCQTASTIAAVAKDGALRQDTFVIVRVYETNDVTLVNKIVLSTNNQNQITSRNLRANDTLQVNMEAAFKIHDYYYERKPRQFGPKVSADKIYTNEEVGQAFLALVLKSPSDARSRKYKIWAEMNDRVFGGASVEQYIFASLAIRQLAVWLKASKHHSSKGNSERTLAKRGLYHVGRVAAFKILDGDDWSNTSKLTAKIIDLESNPSRYDKLFSEAYDLVAGVIARSEYKGDVERAIKSSSTDKRVEKALYVK